MKYNHMNRFFSLALLLALSVPVSMAEDVSYNEYGVLSQPTSESAMVFSANVKLTDNNEQITLSLRDSDAKQVLRMFADKVGKNIVFHNSVDGKVTLDLVDMPINEAFNLVMDVTNLNYYLQGNTIIVVAKASEDNQVFSKQEMMVFPVKYVDASKVADFLNSNVFSMKKTGMSSIKAATVNTATNEIIVFGMKSDVPIIQKVIEQLDREPLSKTFAVNHTTPAEMANMICQMLLPVRGLNSSEGAISGGAAGLITGGAASSSSGSDELKLGEGNIACSVSSSSSSMDTNGVAPFAVPNLTVAYFPQRGTVTLMGGSTAQQEMVEKFILANDLKQPQAYLEISIIELNEEGQKDIQNTWGLASKNWMLNFSGGETKVTRNSSPISTLVPVKIFNPESGKYEDGEATLEQIYRNSSYISWQLNYLIENSKARILANPKVMITNGQESVIDLTQDYVEKVTSEFLSSTNAGGAGAGTVQRTYTIGDDQGIKVSLVPFISPEGYVTMNIKPEYSTVAGQVTAPAGIDPNGNPMQDLQATLLSRRNLDLKNIRIKDGETLVIGGMLQEQDTKIVKKIPVLGDLPIIGAAFRSSSTKKVKNELVIMLTPKIINDGEGSIADSL